MISSHLRQNIRRCFAAWMTFVVIFSMFLIVPAEAASDGASDLMLDAWLNSETFVYEISPDAENNDADPVPAGYTVSVQNEFVNLFDGIQWTQPGSYAYTIQQVCPDAGMSGVVYDDAIYDVHVDVDENLCVNVLPYELSSKNALAAGTVAAAPKARVNLLDGELAAGQFEFELVPVGVEYETSVTTRNMLFTAPVIADSTIEFRFNYALTYPSSVDLSGCPEADGVIALLSGGSYELAGIPDGTSYAVWVDGIDGYTFTQDVWTGIIGVDDGIIALNVLPESFLVEGFSDNTYSPDTNDVNRNDFVVEVAPEIQVEVPGIMNTALFGSAVVKAPANNQSLGFDVKPVMPPMPNGTDGITTVANTAGGRVLFGSISYSYPGVYRYQMQEKIPADDTYLYDNSIIDVTVTVAFDAAGNLTAVMNYSENGVETVSPVFENVSITQDENISEVRVEMPEAMPFVELTVPEIYSCVADDGVLINAVASEDFEIQDDAVFYASKVDTDSAEYIRLTNDVKTYLGLTDADSFYFIPYDVGFRTADGVEVEPLSGHLQITMSFVHDPFDGVDGSEKFAVHVLNDDSIDRIDADFAEDNSVTFVISSFSVMGPAMVVHNAEIGVSMAALNAEEIYVPTLPDGIVGVKADSIEEAVDGLINGGTIWLTDDITVDEVCISSKVVVLKSYENPYIVSKSSEGIGENMFVLVDGACLTLENAMIDASDNINGRTVIANTGSKLVVGEGTILANNRAHGAVYLDGSDIEIDGGVIKDNMSSENGGAVLLENGSGFSSSAGEFNDNTAANGGAIYANDTAAVSVNNLIFDGNMATENGGAICVDASGMSRFSLASSIFTENTAALYGGAVRFMADEPEITTIDCTFMSNTSTGDGSRGGALWVGLTGNDVPADGMALQASFSGCTFRGNQSIGENLGKSSNKGIGDGPGGGAVWCECGYSDDISDSVSFDNCQFDANTVVFGWGGAVNVEYVEGITFAGCTVTGNTASDWGGAVHVLNNSTNPSNILIDGGSFTGNHSRMNGGALNICCFTADITIRGNALFEHNIADINAGAIYIGRGAGKYPGRAQECDVKVYMESCRILNNEGNGDSSANKSLDGSTAESERLRNCEQHYHAGAVYIGENCTLYMQDALVMDNRIEDVSGNTFGNGITLCPNAEAYFYPEHGAAVYGNGSGAGMDILAVPHDSYVHQEGLPCLYICDTTPDGQAYNWTNLNGETARTGEYNWDNALSGINTISSGGEYQGESTLEPVGFKAHVNGVMTMDLDSEPKVIISSNVARNFDNANTVYGSGGLMVNGTVFAGDFSISVKKEVTFLDGVTEAEKTAIQNKEFKFELLITDEKEEVDSEEFGFVSPLRTVRVTGISSLGGPKDIETELRLTSTEVSLACDFTVKADEQVTLNFAWDDGKSFKGHNWTFELFEVDTGGALRTEVTWDIVRGDQDVTYKDGTTEKTEKEVKSVDFVCTNIFGHPETGELDITKTVNGSGYDRFWSFDMTVGTPSAEGTYSVGSNKVTFINEQRSVPSGISTMSLNDISETVVACLIQCDRDYKGATVDYFVPDFTYHMRVEADEPLNDTYTMNEYHASTTFVDGVWEQDFGPGYGSPNRLYQQVICLPENIGFTITITANHPELYELRGVLSCRVEGQPSSGKYGFTYTPRLSCGVSRIYADVPQVYGSLTVTNDVVGDGSDKTFSYKIKIFNDNGDDLTSKYVGRSPSFALNPGESCTFGGYAGLHYILEQTPVDGFDTRVSVDGTYPVELWENSMRSNFTGAIGNVYFTNGVGEVAFARGKATVQLKHGQTLKIKELEPGLDYSVVEWEANSNGYITDESNASGKILANAVAAAAFTNTSVSLTLPQTGGFGRSQWVLLSICTCCAGVYVIRWSKKKYGYARH